MTRREIPLRFAAPLAVAYVGCVVLANVLTKHYGLVPIGFGLLVTAGTFAAGASLLARNLTQDAVGRLAVLALMAVGVGLSWWLASPALATASGVAFALSETTDMAIYSPLRSRGFIRAAALATLVSAVVDTFVFLWVAGFPITGNTVTGQLVVKIGVCYLALALIGGGYALLREPVHVEGA